MDEHFEQLVQYIRQQQERGVAEAHIRQILAEHKWESAMVDRAFLTIRVAAVSPDQFGRPMLPRPVGFADHVQNHTAKPHADSRGATRELPADVPAPARYGIVRSLADVARASRWNTGAFLMAWLLSYIVASAGFLVPISSVPSVSSAFLGGVLLPTLVFGWVWFLFVEAVTVALTAPAVYDGTERRKSNWRRIGSAFRQRFGQLLAASALLYGVMVGPLLLVALLSVRLALAGLIPELLVLLLLVFFLAAGVWMIVAAVRYALVVHIALFEPEVRLSRTLARSRELLAGGGQWFLVKGYLLLVGAWGVTAVATGARLTTGSGSDNTLLNIVTLLLAIIAGSALTALYRNRRIVKGRKA